MFIGFIAFISDLFQFIFWFCSGSVGLIEFGKYLRRLMRPDDNPDPTSPSPLPNKKRLKEPRKLRIPFTQFYIWIDRDGGPKGALDADFSPVGISGHLCFEFRALQNYVGGGVSAWKKIGSIIGDKVRSYLKLSAATDNSNMSAPRDVELAVLIADLLRAMDRNDLAKSRINGVNRSRRLKVRKCRSRKQRAIVSTNGDSSNSATLWKLPVITILRQVKLVTVGMSTSMVTLTVNKKQVSETTTTTSAKATDMLVTSTGGGRSTSGTFNTGNKNNHVAEAGTFMPSWATMLATKPVIIVKVAKSQLSLLIAQFTLKSGRKGNLATT